jgi:hypothetical protein
MHYVEQSTYCDVLFENISEKLQMQSALIEVAAHIM